MTAAKQEMEYTGNTLRKPASSLVKPTPLYRCITSSFDFLSGRQYEQSDIAGCRTCTKLSRSSTLISFMAFVPCTWSASDIAK